MRLTHFNKQTIALLGGLLLVVVAMACGGTEPQDRTIDLEVAEGKLTLDPPVIKVNRDDEVTLRIRIDEGGELHLHGYDIEREMAPGQVVDFYFVADATGRFKITFHGEEAAPGSEGEHKEEEEEKTIGFLEVQPR